MNFKIEKGRIFICTTNKKIHGYTLVFLSLTVEVKRENQVDCKVSISSSQVFLGTRRFVKRLYDDMVKRRENFCSKVRRSFLFFRVKVQPNTYGACTGFYRIGSFRFVTKSKKNAWKRYNANILTCLSEYSEFLHSTSQWLEDNPLEHIAR